MQLTLNPCPRKDRKPVERSAMFEPSKPGQGRLIITAGHQSDAYLLTEVGADFGRGFRIEKQSDDSDGYYVLIGSEIDTRCDCKGFLAHGLGAHGAGCKHIAAIRWLIDAGRLPPLCPACCEDHAIGDRQPCLKCQAEINADLDAIAYNCRRDRIIDAA